MPALRIDQTRVTPDIAAALLALCPFGALTMENGRLEVTAACKMCRLCVKNDGYGVVTFVQDEAPAPGADKNLWRGVAVFAQQDQGVLAPVAAELLGKARELAAAIRQPVYALLVGHGMAAAAETLLSYGADVVYVYDDPLLRDFRVLPYAAAFADFVTRVRPGSVLVGATNLGRSLAPRVAARFGTGLTADCTRLEMKENSDLVQIRPAFGGNIMAQIVTPRHRPQFCTVRDKVFSAPCPGVPHGRIVPMAIDPAGLACQTEVLETRAKPDELDIGDAEALVVVGRGLKSQKDLKLVGQLAAALGAQLACTRPLVENGWFGAKRQVGLSGRTVAPTLLLAVGVSGAVQFTAAIRGAATVVAINADADAPIFDVAHYGLVGDLYQIVPRLLARLADREKEVCALG